MLTFVQYVLWLYTHDHATFQHWFVSGLLEQAYRLWLATR